MLGLTVVVVMFIGVGVLISAAVMSILAGGLSPETQAEIQQAVRAGQCKH